MSWPDDALPPERWRYSRPKLYGWLSGLALMVFGGLLCSVPAGVVVGGPTVVFGLFLAVSFALAMGWAPISTVGALQLIVCGLVLLVIGRWAFPIEIIAESYRAGKTLIKHVGPLEAFGFPLMLGGSSLAGLAMAWIREGRPFGFVRGLVALSLIHGGMIAMLAASLYLTSDRNLGDQPIWLWLGASLAITIGIGVRCRFKGWAWPTVSALAALVLPVTWALLLFASRTVAT